MALTTVGVGVGGTGVVTSTGTGSAVLNTSPTLTTPTIDSAQVPTISGTAPLYMCRAWVNFKGTGTVSIRASGNVSSITDGATGLYSVNFTTAMPDANYSVATSGTSLSEFSSDNPSQGPCIASLQTGTFDVYTGSNTTTKDDWIRVCIAVFR